MREIIKIKIFWFVVVILFLFTLIAPTALYKLHISAHHPGGLTFDMLIASIFGSIVYWGITFLIFFILGVPVVVFFRRSPSRTKVLLWEFFLSCMIALVLWWPNVTNF